MANLLQPFLDQVAARPDQIAILESRSGEDHQVSFKDLDQRAAATAGALRRIGIRKGFRVLLLYRLSIDLYIAILALFRIGACVVLIDPGSGKPAFRSALKRSRCQAVLADWRLGWLRFLGHPVGGINIGVAMGGVAPGWHSWRSLNSKPGEAMPVADVSPDHPALLTFTSGSTGEPKGIIRSHAFLLCQRACLAETLHFKPGQRDLTTLPVFVLAHLGSGVTSILAEADLRRPGFVDPAPVLGQMKRLRPDRCGAAPAFLNRLLEGARATGQTLDSFRRVYTGGGPVTLPFLQQLADFCPHARVFALYGSTEAEPIALMPIEDLPTPSEDIALPGLPTGIVAPDLDCRIIRDHWGSPVQPQTEAAWQALQLPPLETGEILVAGPHVVQGYLNSHGDTETKIHQDGKVWHRTGDAGYFDAEGRLWLCGRCSAKVSVGEGILYPFQVEALVHPFPQIRRSAFVAGPNTEPILCLEWTHPDSPQNQEVEKQLKAILNKKGLAAVHCVTLKGIPVDNRHNSKIDYPALQKKLVEAFQH